MIALCIISEAKAAPVCAEKQDAYKSALADMQGTGEKLWNELVAEGKCANVPARYLWTMDTHKHPEFTRVTTYLAFGRHVYGLTTTLSTGLWLIDDHQHPPQDMALHEKFYSTWNVPNNGNERVASCCNLKDCYPTTIKKVGEHWYAQRREDFQWILIPEGKLEHNQPDGSARLTTISRGAAARPRDRVNVERPACHAPIAMPAIRRRCRVGSGNPRLAVSVHRFMHCAIDEM